MGATTVIRERSKAESKSLDFRVVVAFLAIYIIWGTSFLGIRIVVLELPPLFSAGIRFFVAGAVLYAFMHFRGRTRPTARQWRSLAILGLLLFVAEYGPLFWAEKYVPSGIASVLEATLPLITMALETWVFRRYRFHWSVLGAILLGFCGVSVLLFHNGAEQFGLLPCIAILAGATTWSLGSVLSRSLDLPESKALTSGAAMLLGGGVLLALSAVFGELHPFPHVSMRAGMALLYLIVFPSLVGFTAFVWLLARMPATRVASHAYVNPVVAVALGYFAAGEAITERTLAGTVLVLASVVLILRKQKAAA
jgi:drug/metabolite transporter (DMT)-like permease